MATAPRKARKSSKAGRAWLIRQMESAGPKGEALGRLVKKHPAPQQWYDEDNAGAVAAENI
jgi:hypothetical protein